MLSYNTYLYCIKQSIQLKTCFCFFQIMLTTFVLCYKKCKFQPMQNPLHSLSSCLRLHTRDAIIFTLPTLTLTIHKLCQVQAQHDYAQDVKTVVTMTLTTFFTSCVHLWSIRANIRQPALEGLSSSRCKVV